MFKFNSQYFNAKLYSNCTKPLCCILLFSFLSTGNAMAYGKSDYSNATVKGKIAITINYTDENLKPVSAVRIVLDEAPIVLNSTTVQAGSIKISLSGIETCSGRIDTRDYSGTCEEVAMEAFNDVIRYAHVWICNAFVSEKGKNHQFATCYTRTFLEGGIDFRGMIEDDLVGLGSHRVVIGKDGKPQRPDLLKAQETAVFNHFQMWNIKK